MNAMNAHEKAVRALDEFNAGLRYPRTDKRVLLVSPDLYRELLDEAREQHWATVRAPENLTLVHDCRVFIDPAATGRTCMVYFDTFIKDRIKRI